MVERFKALQEDQEELGCEIDGQRGKDPEAPEEDQETNSSTEVGLVVGDADGRLDFRTEDPTRALS